MKTTEELDALRTLLARDIDYVLEWLYGEVHADLPGLLDALVAILCDRTATEIVRQHAAEAVQSFGTTIPVTPDLLARVERVRLDGTESVALRSSALGALAVLSIWSKMGGRPGSENPVHIPVCTPEFSARP